MDFKEMNPLGIVGIVGAIILVVGVFMNWLSIDYLFDSDSYTGWKLFTDADDMMDNYMFAPLLCLVMGILSIALMVLPTVMNAEKFQQINNILGVVAIVLSIVVVVIMILFWTQEVHGVKLTDVYDIEIGFWLCFVGAIITAVGGIMPILKNKGIIKF